MYEIILKALGIYDWFKTFKKLFDVKIENGSVKVEQKKISRREFLSIAGVITGISGKVDTVKKAATAAQYAQIGYKAFQQMKKELEQKNQ